MKFGDKLVELRKKNGLSQEELAEKLGVSRQSVSKWESNNTYPETDKIIQIANLFDCSMDDLINDKVVDIDSTLRKNKNNLNNVWDSLLEFITKTVNMFSKMKFTEGLKCVIEMFILALLLSILGKILCGTVSSIITNIFSFLHQDIINTIKDVLYGIFGLIWFVIAIITLIHTFKIRYLNYYEEPKKEETIKNKNVNNKEENVEKTTQQEKIIVRDERPFEFLSILSLIVIVFIKFIAFWILLGTVFSTIGLIISIVFALIHIPAHIIFFWILLLLIAGTVVSIQVIIILISFLFDKKINVITHLIIFISCVVLSGVSIALIALTAKNIDFITDTSAFNPQTTPVEINYKDNLVIDNYGMGEDNKFKYIIDNDIEENKIIATREVDTKYFKLNVKESEMDKMPVITIVENDNGDVKAFYNLFIKNLKKNKIYTFGEYGNDPLVIKANEDTINKLIDNQKKLYLVEENRHDNEIDVIVHDSKVHFKNGLRGEYNGLDDTIKYDEENYSCNKDIEKTEYGEKFIYTCDYQE